MPTAPPAPAATPTAAAPASVPAAAPASPALRQAALRFLVAGGLNAALNYLLFRLFLAALAGRPGAAGTAQALAYAIGVAVGYVVNQRWTFRGAGGRGHAGALPRFLAAHLGSLAVSTTLVETGTARLGLDPSLCWVLATGVTTVMNFAMQRFWVFPERPAR